MQTIHVEKDASERNQKKNDIKYIKTLVRIYFTRQTEEFYVLLVSLSKRM